MSRQAVDVGESPWEFLSNFTAYAFIFRGFLCASMEGFLQSLKTPLIEKQISMHALVGIKAKRKGQKMKWYLRDHELFWQGVAMDRFSPEYIAFIEEAFVALYEQNETFRQALLATGERPLIHSHGKADPKYTILTEEEFVSILTRLRSGELKAKIPKKHKTTGKFETREDLTSTIFDLISNSDLQDSQIAKITGVSLPIVQSLSNSLEHHIWSSIEGNLVAKSGHNPDDIILRRERMRVSILKETMGIES